MPIQGNLVTPVGENPDGDVQGLKFDANGKLKVNVTGMLVLALTNQSITPYFTDITAAVNFRYFLDLSELVLTKSLIIPAGAVGDRIIVSITAAHGEFAFVIKGAAGVTINRGSAATEWTRLLIVGENLELTADSTSNWQVTIDGRIPCFGIMYNSAQQTFANAQIIKINHNNTTKNVGGIVDIANNRFICRRSNDYRFLGRSYFQATLIPHVVTHMYVNGAEKQRAQSDGWSISTRRMAVLNYVRAFSPADIIDHRSWQDSGGNAEISVDDKYRPFVELKEQL